MLYTLHHVMPPSHAYYSCTRDTAFDAYLPIWIYQYIYTYLYMPLGIHLNICWGVSDSPGLAYSGSEARIEVYPIGPKVTIPGLGVLMITYHIKIICY